ncbi:MAG TPA: efflux RND transporter periplasmic adaptor subunit [Terriglobales bacterium]|nr:efflux RND transporter periplasmic adaptor subunit [Terriglobales bacterium]
MRILIAGEIRSRVIAKTRAHRCTKSRILDADRLIFVLLLAAFGALTACSGKPKGPQGPPPAMLVKVNPISAQPVSDSSEYVATLKSRDSANIMPQVEGIITHIFVHSGDRVSAGTPPMQIDPVKQEATVRNQEAATAAQEANLKLAQQQYDRSSQLAAAGVISREQLDQARANLDAAKAQLTALKASVNEQEAQLHFYRVVAPMAGIVGDIPVRVGDRVITTTLLTTIDKPGSLEAYVQVPIERAPDLKMGKEVEILGDQGNTIAKGKVTFISPQVDSQTQTILVKATVPNDKGLLRTAQFVHARVVWGTHPGIEVPVLAVSRVGGQFFVYVAENSGGKSVAHQRQIKVGPLDGNNYVVLDGLKPGDKVIVSDTQMLADGMPVNAQPQGS